VRKGLSPEKAQLLSEPPRLRPKPHARHRRHEHAGEIASADGGNGRIERFCAGTFEDSQTRRRKPRRQLLWPRLRIASRPGHVRHSITQASLMPLSSRPEPFPRENDPKRGWSRHSSSCQYTRQVSVFVQIANHSVRTSRTGGSNSRPQGCPQR